MYKKSERRWLTYMRIGKRLGCHQRADRSFFIKGYQFPVCARCTGVIISSLLAVFAFFISPISIGISFLLSLIMFLDWFMQYIKIKESNNIRRLVTGLLGGYGFMTLQMYVYRFIGMQICSLIYGG